MNPRTNPSSRTLYLGLGSTYHDPALAVIDDTGQVVFAEALERPLQYKRAINMEPDNPFELPRVLKTYGKGVDRIVIASNWKARRPWYENWSRRLGWLTPKGILLHQGRQLTACLPTWELNYMQALQHQALKISGLTLSRTLREGFGGPPSSFAATIITSVMRPWVPTAAALIAPPAPSSTPTVKKARWPFSNLKAAG